MLFYIGALSIYIPNDSARGFFFSTSSPAFIVCRFLDDGYSDWCELIPHCNFHFNFSNNEWYWASFHVFVGHLYVFPWRNVCLLWPIFWLGHLFFWNWAACIFWRLILCQLFNWFYLLHSEVCLFALLIVSFIVQKLLSLIRSHLFTFGFISITFGSGS